MFEFIIIELNFNNFTLHRSEYIFHIENSYFIIIAIKNVQIILVRFKPFFFFLVISALRVSKLLPGVNVGLMNNKFDLQEF